MFRLKNDNSSPIITAEAHIKSSHKLNNKLDLPDTAVLFFMNSGIEYMLNNYNCELISENFPRFLGACPIYLERDNGYCFLHGGSAAPQAVDTLETLNAFGVKNVISIGMYGAFSDKVDCGDIVVPCKAFVEEGTSLHYYENTEYSTPSKELFNKAVKSLGAKDYPIVSTDAVYRQTFAKEQEWREKGAVGVDMETSALYSVGKYLDINVVSILIASDKHPITPDDKKWQWHLEKSDRYNFFEKCINFVKVI